MWTRWIARYHLIKQQLKLAIPVSDICSRQNTHMHVYIYVHICV